MCKKSESPSDNFILEKIRKERSQARLDYLCSLICICPFVGDAEKLTQLLKNKIKRSKRKRIKESCTEAINAVFNFQNNLEFFY